MPEEFSLGWTEVDVAVRRTGLPASWHPFEIRSAGYTLDEHERLSDAAWDAMRARGLADADKLDHEVAATLRTWTRPEVLVIVRAAELAGGTVLYRACAGEGLGVFSEALPDGIRFRQVRPERLVETVLSMFPPYASLPVPPVTITQGDGAARPAEPPDNSDRDFTDDTPTRRDRDALAPYSRWPLHRHGTVELSLRHGQGRLRPAGTTTFVDTDGGRYLTFTETLPDGHTRLRFTPSDGSHLRRWLLDRIAEGWR
ncbi:ESX secretion-associated protein EspG [Amycolatopsis sp. PS_44_ISF1]|uniref:ESX secretion-associated protein EspG n=1 Tax=Amycolatopsis sp. PS_44_ISF1 TaxID=2974917 RepID=UPI0028DFC028|nr:ESX secretion-associated protein EspG [Amycolatopsis sp. PS_44_ISF1]MDT8911151.1 ESX secretion-associated protein EspG [Amycolatopsis sp. PS_44_ISF1]